MTRPFTPEARPLVAGDRALVADLLEASGEAAAARFADWDLALAQDPHSAWGLVEKGQLVAAGTCRLLGRQGHVVALAVPAAARGRGLGTRLLEALSESLARHEASVIGAEVAAGDGETVAFLARRGCRVSQAVFALEADVVSGQGELSDGLELFSDAGSALPRLDELSALAASLDADFDPSRLVARQLADRRAELLLARAGGALTGAAVLVARESGLLEASLVLCNEAPPFPTLELLGAGLASVAASRGLTRVRVPGPTRWADAFRRLIELGFRPAAPFVRLTRSGYPERSHHARALLASWR